MLKVSHKPLFDLKVFEMCFEKSRLKNFEKFTEKHFSSYLVTKSNSYIVVIFIGDVRTF